MRIIIVRHAEPNYTKDSLTEKGFREAAFLNERLKKMKLDYAYVSPFGRAAKTCEIGLQGIDLKAETLDWLKEFQGKANKPNTIKTNAWDWRCEEWTEQECFFDKDDWKTGDGMLAGDEYDYVIKNFDSLLEKHGYKRFRGYYKAIHPNDDTIILFCHFAIECVLLSRLMNCSPMVLWHGLCAAPSSVSVIYTEERTDGNACFRMQSFGDISHLYANNEDPSFMARFCELYSNTDERHD